MCWNISVHLMWIQLKCLVSLILLFYIAILRGFNSVISLHNNVFKSQLALKKLNETTTTSTMCREERKNETKCNLFNFMSVYDSCWANPILAFMKSAFFSLQISSCRENVQKLFEYWCEISPTAIGEKVSGVIVESFPERFKDPEIISKIPEFAYPCQFLK